MKILVTIWFFFMAFQCSSQNLIPDSLRQKFSHFTGKEKISGLNNLAKAYLTLNPKRSVSLGNKAIKLARQLKYDGDEGYTYGIIGKACYYRKHYKLADLYFDTALEIDEKQGKSEAVYKILHNKIFLYGNRWVNDSVKGQHIFRQYIKMALQKKDYFNLHQALMGYVNVYHNPKTKDSLLINYLNRLYAGQKEDNEIIADILGCEGYLYRNNRMYSRSIRKYEQGLMYVPEEEVARTIFDENSGILYSEMGMHKESLSYFRKAHALLRRQKQGYSNAEMCFLDACIGENYIDLGDYKHALKYLMPALNNINIFGPHDEAFVYNNAGKAYTLLDSTKKAEYFINKAFNIFDSLNIKEGKLASLNSLANLFMRNNNKAKLSKIIDELSFLLTQKGDSSVSEYYVAESYKLLSDYYAKKGDYKSSNKFLEKGETVYDSFLMENVLELSELKTKYEIARKDEKMKVRKLAPDNKMAIIRYSLGGIAGIFLVLIMIAVFYRKRDGAFNLSEYPYPATKKQNTFKKFRNGLIANDHRETIKKSKIDDSLKRHIAKVLKEQINNKVYLEPDLTLKTLAEKCGTNRTYLSRVIHEIHKINFNDFINKCRIEEAKRILADPENQIPLKALPERVGFKNYARFHEAFKKHTGISPSFFVKNDTHS